ncbi:MAG: DUF1232 domain-containing protein [Candidatus Omnitrophota bacterium]
MFKKLKRISKDFKNELKVYKLVLQDSRTPKTAKFLLKAAIGYAVLPFDIIPDFIPIIGHLDDMIIVPGLIFLAYRLIPKEIIEDCRKRAKEKL